MPEDGPPPPSYDDAAEGFMGQSSIDATATSNMDEHVLVIFVLGGITFTEISQIHHSLKTAAEGSAAAGAGGNAPDGFAANSGGAGVSSVTGLNHGSKFTRVEIVTTTITDPSRLSEQLMAVL